MKGLKLGIASLFASSAVLVLFSKTPAAYAGQNIMCKPQEYGDCIHQKTVENYLLSSVYIHIEERSRRPLYVSVFQIYEAISWPAKPQKVFSETILVNPEFELGKKLLTLKKDGTIFEGGFRIYSINSFQEWKQLLEIAKKPPKKLE